MQKLTVEIKRLLRNESGATLIGAVVLCLIMAIGAAGLMGITRNVASMGVDAHDDARAFLAAEGGLRMLTDWVYNNHAIVKKGSYPIIGGVNGVPVTVAIDKPDNLSETQWVLSSTANLVVDRRLPYTKTVEWSVDLKDLGDVPGFFVEDGWFNDNDEKGISGMVFNGPTHFNTALNLDNINCKNDQANCNAARFLGALTLANRTDLTDVNKVKGQYSSAYYPPDVSNYSGSGSHSDNDYTSGVKAKSASFENLEKVFQSTYNPNDSLRSVKIDNTKADRIDVIKNGERLGAIQIPNDAFVGTTMPAIKFGYDNGKPYYKLYKVKKEFKNEGKNNETWELKYETDPIVTMDYDDGGKGLIIATDYELVVMPSLEVSGIVTVVATNNLVVDVSGDRDIAYNGTTITDRASGKMGVGANVSGSGDNLLALYSSESDVIFYNAGNKNNHGVTVTAQVYARNGTVTVSDREQADINVFGVVVMKEWYDEHNQGKNWLKWRYDNGRGNMPAGISWEGIKEGGIIYRWNWRECNNVSDGIDPILFCPQTVN